MSTIQYHLLTPDDSPAVSRLIQRVIREFNIQDYTAEGVQLLMGFTSASSLRTLLSAKDTIGVAGLVVEGNREQMVGVCIFRDWHHLTLFFVDGDYQGQGIGRETFERALAECRNHQPDLDVLTVNSSLFAVDVYRKMGFVATTDEPEERNGVIFVPMQKVLTS